MLDLYKMFSRTMKHYQNRYDEDNSHWQGIKSKMRCRFLWNVGVTSFFIVFAAAWNQFIQPIQVSSLGILLVGIGAVRLALVSARSHMREFDDSSHHIDAVESRRTTEYRPRVAGNMVDAVSGFVLVAVGFSIRVGVQFV